MKRTSKSTQAASKSRVKNKVILADAQDEMVYSEEDSTMSTSATQSKTKYVFTLAAILIIVGLAVFKFSYVLIPAKVGNQPVFFWSYLNYLHKNYGKDGMQRLTTQVLVNAGIAKSGVVVKPEAIQAEIDLLDKQASASGGIQATLTANQMTMADLRDQLRIQLAVKQILKDKIAVTDAEALDAYKKNKDVFKGLTEAEALVQVKSQLENQKFQTEASAWLADLRKNTPITISYPGLSQ